MSAWIQPSVPEYTQPERAMLNIEAKKEVSLLLDTLPLDTRTAIILKYWHKMSYKEIAQSLDTTVSAVKSKLFRAKKKLAHKTALSKKGNVVYSPQWVAQAI